MLCPDGRDESDAGISIENSGCGVCCVSTFEVLYCHGFLSGQTDVSRGGYVALCATCETLVLRAANG